MRIDHSTHSHPNTKADRAACRKAYEALLEYAWLGSPEQQEAEVLSLLEEPGILITIEMLTDRAADAHYHRRQALGDEAPKEDPYMDAISVIYETS